MLNKTTFGILVVLALAAVAVLAGKDSDNPSSGGSAQAQPGGPGGPGGGPPPGPEGPRFMREGFGPWFNQLAEAYDQNNKQKMGELIGEMKTRMQSMQAGMGRPGAGGPPEGMDRPDRGGRPGQGRFGRPDSDQPSRGASSLAKNDAEKTILAVLDDMDKNQRGGMMNVPAQDGRLLRLLAQIAGAKRVVEIGTSNGYSGIWFCLALQGTGGKLITHEIDAGRASLARQNFKRAGVEQIVTLVEGDAHETVKKLSGPVDVVFIDADKPGYMDYLNKVLPLVRPDGLILAHNTGMAGSEMGDFLKAITTDPNLETMFLGQQGGGLSVTLKKR